MTFCEKFVGSKLHFVRWWFLVRNLWQTNFTLSDSEFGLQRMVTSLWEIYWKQISFLRDSKFSLWNVAISRRLFVGCVLRFMGGNTSCGYSEFLLKRWNYWTKMWKGECDIQKKGWANARNEEMCGLENIRIGKWERNMNYETWEIQDTSVIVIRPEQRWFLVQKWFVKTLCWFLHP